MTKVSVITPLYNSVDYIAKTIRSVQSQTFQDWEMIIVDDCSSDGSYQRALELAKGDNRIKVVRLSENSGPAVARNKAIKMAVGKYIAFLDSDDSWAENKLDFQLSFMQREGALLTYTAYDVVGENGVYIRSVGVPDSVTYGELLKTCVIGCLTAVYNAEALGKIYMPLIRKRQDFGLWLRILKTGVTAYGINKPLAQYTLRNVSVSSNKTNAAKYTWKLFREVERLNFFKALYFFAHYAVRGLMRHRYPKLALKLGVMRNIEN